MLRHVFDGLSFAEVAERTGETRERIKRCVCYWRARGMEIPLTPKSKRQGREPVLSLMAERMIALSQQGFSNEQIAERLGETKRQVSKTLSYHRCKGRAVPHSQLPLAQYQALYEQGLTQSRIASELRVGKRIASLCHAQLMRDGLIDPQQPRADVPVGEDKWALPLGRKKLF